MTSVPDCAVIAAAFEKGAHYSANEKAVFATLTRGVQGTKSFAKASQKTLGSWRRPGNRRAGSLSEGFGEVTEEGVSFSKGAAGTTEDFVLSIPAAIASPEGQAEIRKCLPCLGRIEDYLTWGPTKNFIDLFLLDIQNRLQYLRGLDDLITQGMRLPYGGLCDLLAMLKNMCILDLQKILFLLAALNMDLSINLDGLMPMLKGLIVPLLAPPLMNINSILDQITSLVTAPIDCIIELLTLTINDLNVIAAVGEADYRGPSWNRENGAFNFSLVRPIAEKSTSLTKEQRFGAANSLITTRDQLVVGKKVIEEKATGYKKMFAGFIGQWKGLDSQYLGFSLARLVNIRLIGIIAALVKALSQGKELCPEGRDPTNEEFNLFTEVFLNDHNPVKVIFDEDGVVGLSEAFDVPIEDIRELREDIRELGLPQEDQLAMASVSPVTMKLPCRLRTTQSQVTQVNQWMAELNTVS